MTADRKRALRADMKARRQVLAADREDAARAATAAAARVMTLDLPPSGVVALYWPLGDELDTRPLADLLQAAGYGLALPVVIGRDQPLIFRTWQPDASLVSGFFNVMTPEDTAELQHPDVIIVPLLAFDAACDRLGYGGGFYDRTLAGLRQAAQKPIMRIGFAFEGQRVDAIPRQSDDQTLDYVVTDQAVYRASI